MTGDDLKRRQDHFLEGAKQSLLETRRLRPTGFVVTLFKHVEKLLESGWALEILDPVTACIRHSADDQVATIVLDLLMDWRRLYHATLIVFPETRDFLPDLVALGVQHRIDDPYKRVMRPFMAQAHLDEKDVIAATMRHVCEKVDAFACILQMEAWMRIGDDRRQVPGNLANDQKAVEVILSSMETYDFTRMVMLPIHRRATKLSKKRDQGKVIGFGDPVDGLDTPADTNVIEGRLVRFLKPLGIAS